MSIFTESNYLEITDVWLLTHIFREVDLLKLADLTQSTLFITTVLRPPPITLGVYSRADLNPKATTLTY